ncbi:MAG: MerR family transcriptional regulator [Gemmatimonadota bacterium]
MALSIGELATAVGLSVQTIRYYERRGLLAPPPRTASGYRQYSPETADRLRFIRRAQELGFTLEEIHELLELRVRDPAACAAVETRTRRKIEQVEAKLRELGRLKRVLERLARACERRTPTAECPVLDMLTEMSHDTDGAVSDPGEGAQPEHA